ncbi:penicillin-binding transpeptidase domain-containing protein [Nocardioides insulae]|uniref:penicillin-binding transpeptidase domain-containing protein n=1 Tax=Nocardioides insulae TaxID=394734 RepID=UPI00041E2091|nr:penicillin-binding transpeptidase domain-containing protein [Nocardioides insulae]
MIRPRALIVPLLALALTATACTGEEDPGPDQAAEALAEALVEGGDSPTWQDVGFATGTAQEAAADYLRLVDGLGGLTPVVEVDEVTTGEDATTATLAWTWPVGEGWTYTSDVELTRSAGEWDVEWAPSVVHPQLSGEQVLDLERKVPVRADILGAGGTPLVTDRPVSRVGIDKAVAGDRAVASARRLARRLDIDDRAYVARVRASGEKAFVEAVVYRQDEVPAGLTGIPGAVSLGDRLPLGPSREFAAPILGDAGEVTAEIVEQAPDRYRSGDVAGLSGLQARYDEQLRGTPGAVITAVAPDGTATELTSVDPVPGRPLRLTLDLRLQSYAEGLLGDTGAAALVALRPSDGAILAAANAPANDGLNLATYGQAAPGSTFKAVSSLALLRSGLSPESGVECPAELSVDGKRFENYDDYPASSLGSITLAEAVAQSCNTAFVGSSDRVSEDDLAAAAASLGLGIDHEVGFPAYFGQVPAPRTEVEKAADLIGQGTITASPMAMATMIGSVVSGHTVVPHLVDGVTSPVPDRVQRLTPRESAQLRGMLRAVVTEGSGAGLADVPGAPVIAKTGTAEFESGGSLHTHAWMVAAQGDLAVAVYLAEGESGSGDAGPILEDFLRSATAS